MFTLLAPLLALVLFLLAPTTAAAQAGNAQAGKTLWEGPATQCRNCHGTNGEGAFGPDLAGRRLTVPQFRRAVRQPWGIMPAFVESQVSDREIADLVAYFDGLPAVAQPGPWRFTVPAGAPRGLEVALSTVGCAQCHGPTLNGPRQNMGAINADFEWVKRMVYDHAKIMPAHWKTLGEEPAVRVRMGTYSPARLPESLVQEVWTYARDLGYRPLIASQLSAGVAAASGVTYSLTVQNSGLPNRGLTAEDLTVNLVVPAGANVVSTTGSGYQGVRADAGLKANVAVWQLGKLAPKDRQTYSLTLSRAGTAADNVRGVVRWAKPVVKTGPSDEANIAPAPLTTATQ
ncbi:MAG: c-type cytochrome [Acidobacteria bacterium]|nr:c-type cytochrome [Acidobacteriota bacterium]